MGIEAQSRFLSATAGAISALVSWIDRNAIAVLIGYCVLLLAALGAASTLTIDTDSSKMLNPELEFQEKSLALREAFPQQKETIVVVIRAPNPDLADQTAHRLLALLQDRPGIDRLFAPALDPFLMGHGLLYLSLDEVDEQLSRLTTSANLIAGLRSEQSIDGFIDTLNQARVLAEGAGEEGDLAPIYAEAARVFGAAATGDRRDFGWTGAFTGEDGDTLRVINIRPELDYTALNPAKPALASVRAAIDALGEIPGVEVGMTGDPALRQEELRAVAAKIGWSLGLSLLFVAVVLWLALRTLGRMLLGLGALLSTLILTAGFAAISVGSLNLISIAFIVLMVGLGIDFAIHFMAHLDEKARQGRHALVETALSIGPALALTACSTAVAFLAFTTTDFIGMAQLGLIGGGGVLIAFGVSITLIPAIASLRPALMTGRARGRIPSGLSGRRAFPLIMFAVGVAAIWPATSARFDADPMSLRDPNAPSVRAFGWLAEDARRSPLRLAVLATSAEEAAALADRLETVDGVDAAAWLGSLVPADQFDKLDLVDLAWPSIEHAVSGTPEALTDTDPATLTGLAGALDGDPNAADLASSLRAYHAVRTPEGDSALTEMLFETFPLLIGRLEAMLDIEEVTEDRLPEDLVERFRAQSGLYLVEIRPAMDIRNPSSRAAFVDTVKAAVDGVTGAPAQIEGARRAVASAMLQAVTIAMIGAGALSLIFLRSITGTAAILVPVMLASAVCMAAGVLLDLPFNYANVIVLPLMIGIGVDSGIHLALRARQTGEVFETSTPMATFYSALTTIAAFGTLALSDHRGTASMGILLAIGLTATVLMTFALTPILASAGRTKS
ncbi:MAG: MMPL family transporter [Pseudomonadota bacterium]